MQWLISTYTKLIFFYFLNHQKKIALNVSHISSEIIEKTEILTGIV